MCRNLLRFWIFFFSDRVDRFGNLESFEFSSSLRLLCFFLPSNKNKIISRRAVQTFGLVQLFSSSQVILIIFNSSASDNVYERMYFTLNFCFQLSFARMHVILDSMWRTCEASSPFFRSTGEAFPCDFFPVFHFTSTVLLENNSA